jgi:NAD(P)H-flavin reductase
MAQRVERADRVSPDVPRPHAVSGVKRETADTVTLELLPERSGAPAFSAGQFNMLYAFGVGEAAISISGDPTRAGPVIHTVRAVGPVSSALGSLRRGDVVGVRGPFGTPWPVEEAAGCDVVLVAGGIGLAPLRPTLYEILARRSRFGRVSLLYGTRTPADLLFRGELRQWRGRFDLDVEVTVDHAAAERFDNVGVVTRLIPRAAFDPDETVAMVCGPEVMMRFTVRELLGTGVPAERIFVSLERGMRCGVGLCGHCQLGPRFVCKDGPVFRWSEIAPLLEIREL